MSDNSRPYTIPYTGSRSRSEDEGFAPASQPAPARNMNGSIETHYTGATIAQGPEKPSNNGHALYIRDDPSTGSVNGMAKGSYPYGEPYPYNTPYAAGYDPRLARQLHGWAGSSTGTGYSPVHGEAPNPIEHSERADTSTGAGVELPEKNAEASKKDDSTLSKSTDGGDDEPNFFYNRTPKTRPEFEHGRTAGIADQQIKDQQAMEQQIKDLKSENKRIRVQKSLVKQILDQRIKNLEIENQKITDQQMKDQKIWEQKAKDLKLDIEQVIKLHTKDQQFKDQQIMEQQFADQQIKELEVMAQQIKDLKIEHQQTKYHKIENQKIMEQMIKNLKIENQQIKDQLTMERANHYGLQQINKQQLEAIRCHDERNMALNATVQWQGRTIQTLISQGASV